MPMMVAFAALCVLLSANLIVMTHINFCKSRAKKIVRYQCVTQNDDNDRSGAELVAVC